MKNSLILNMLTVILIATVSSCSDNKDKKPIIIPINVMVDTIGSPKADSQGISYNGTVQESKGIDVSFQVSGTVTQVLVEKGQHVNKGQLLATIDETTYRNQYNAQLAQLEQAEDNYKRTAEVYKEGSIAEVKNVEAQTNSEQARATAKATYQNIIHCRIYSPSDGYVGDKSVEAGNIASPGNTSFKIVKLQTVKIVVPVPEDEISKLKKGQPATIKISSLNNQIYKGNIAEIGVLASDDSHNYDVKILIANPNTVLKPGMLADVNFNVKPTSFTNDTSGISVPLVALQVDEKGNNFVYVADNSGNKALFRAIKTGGLLKDAILVKKGLLLGDRVIISGYHKITNESPIHIVQ